MAYQSPHWHGVYVPNAPGNLSLRDFPCTTANFDAIKPKHAPNDSTDPDLSEFLAHGGKLLLWHGLADPHTSPLNFVACYGAS